jgi:hypothetical protein
MIKTNIGHIHIPSEFTSPQKTKFMLKVSALQQKVAKRSQEENRQSNQQTLLSNTSNRQHVTQP